MVSQMTSYRQVGGRLWAYIRANDPSTQQIQAFLGDLLAGDELLLPMRDLVARPIFQSIRGLAGSGQGVIQRDSCLQELSRSYLPKIVDQVNQLISGMLDLAKKEARNHETSSQTYLPKSKEDTTYAMRGKWASRDNESSKFISNERRSYINSEIERISIGTGGVKREIPISERPRSDCKHLSAGLLNRTKGFPLFYAAISFFAPIYALFIVISHRSWRAALYPCIVILGFMIPAPIDQYVGILPKALLTPLPLHTSLRLGDLLLRIFFLCLFTVHACRTGEEHCSRYMAQQKLNNIGQ